MGRAIAHKSLQAQEELFWREAEAPFPVSKALRAALPRTTPCPPAQHFKQAGLFT